MHTVHLICYSQCTCRSIIVGWIYTCMSMKIYAQIVQTLWYIYLWVPHYCRAYLLTLGAHVQRGLQYLDACACVSVKSNLTSGLSVRHEISVKYSTGNKGQKICGDFSETAPLQRYTVSCLVGYCSDIPRTFLTEKPSKGPKKANNRLKSTWNTTQCKVASFFLFSLRLLPKVFRILFVNVITDLALALSKIRTRAYAEGSALWCIHSIQYYTPNQLWYQSLHFFPTLSGSM